MLAVDGSTGTRGERDRGPARVRALHVGRLMGRPDRGPVARPAIVLAALVLSLFVPSTAAAARSEFFGIVQGPTLDGQDIQGMADAKIRTNRFLLNWKWVQPTAGPPRWGAMDKFIGRLAVRGVRAVPSVWGNPGWVQGGDAKPPLDRPQDITAWQNFLKALVARYGPTGTYWPNAYRQQYGAGATPLPIQSWQIWNEPNLKKFYVPVPGAPAIRPAGEVLTQRDPQQGSPGPDRARRNARLRGHQGLGLPQDLLQPGRDQELLRRRRPAPVRSRHRPRPRPDPERPGGDGEPRRRGHAAVAHRDRLGLGPPRPASASTRASRAKSGCSGTPTT